MENVVSVLSIAETEGLLSVTAVLKDDGETRGLLEKMLMKVKTDKLTPPHR